MAEACPPVSNSKRCIKALKKLQAEHTRLEAELYNERHALEKKYLELYKPYFEKRHAIVTGAHEPTDEEATFILSEEESDEEEIRRRLEALQVDNSKVPEAVPEVSEPAAPGVVGFWLTVFKNFSRVAAKIQLYDEPVLKALHDVQLTYLDDQKMQGFRLDFHFDENEYFSNSVLSKTYDLLLEDDSPELTFVKAEGTPIQWHPGKNVTMHTVTRRQRNRVSKEVRTTTKQTKRESFFDFFSPPATPLEEDESEEADATHEVLADDYELGEILKDNIIPYAIRYFLGEDGDSEDLDEDEDEDLDEDEDSDEDD